MQAQELGTTSGSSKAASLPPYLAKYIVQQDYAAYTSQEHASWRYIMRQSRRYFAQHAVSIYLDGLKKTGIPIQRIPRIDEMDRCLSEFGWGAVGVCGFIPSSVFLDLLARGIMPIATGMRTLAHLAYTPAPDIVHEAAGHAPIVADAAYRNFLERYAEVAYRAIITKEDIALYEAVRYLSDIKENPDTAPAEIHRAQERLKAAYRLQTSLSEAGKVARLAWWTIEYGLVGDLRAPKIYGAGLLSSVGESQACLSAKIKKIPLSLACVDTAYDITEHQPQLFVAPDMETLPELLTELGATFVYRRGGLVGVQTALDAGTINTLTLESGLGMSGKLSTFLADAGGALEFVKFSGPCQLSYLEKELPQQGRSHHPEGFSTPLGRWDVLDEYQPTTLSDQQLHSVGIAQGKVAELKFTSGFVVKGIVKNWQRQDGKLLYITWADCTVRRGEQVFFRPEWGSFDMAVGEKVVSVYGGPADRAAFGDYEVGNASTSPGRTSAFSDDEKSVFNLYQNLRQWRENKCNSTAVESLQAIAASLCRHHRQQWLLGVELMELAAQRLGLDPKDTEWLKEIDTEVLAPARASDSEVAALIDRGLEIKMVLD